MAIYKEIILKIVLLLLVPTLSLVSLAQPAKGATDDLSIIMLPQDLGTDISGRVDTFKNPDNSLTLSDVSAPEFDGFIRNKQSGYSPGIFSGSLWVRITLQDNNHEPEPLYLLVDSPLLEARFYQRSQDGIAEQKGGRYFASEEESIHSTFPTFRLLPPEQGQTRVYYLKIRNDGVHSLALSILKGEAVWGRDRLASWFGGAVTGAILIMIAYNLFLYFSTREVDFLWYSLTVAFLHFGHIASVVTNSVFYSGKLSIFTEIWIPVTKVLGTICLIQFSRYFLRTKVGSKGIDRILVGVNIFALVMLFSLAFVPAAKINAIHNIGGLIGLVTIIIYSGYLFSKGAKYARFYFIAWFPMLLIAILRIAVAMSGNGHLLYNTRVGLDAVRSQARQLGGDAKAVLGQDKPNGNREIQFELTVHVA